MGSRGRVVVVAPDLALALAPALAPVGEGWWW